MTAENQLDLRLFWARSIAGGGLTFGRADWPSHVGWVFGWTKPEGSIHLQGA